LLYTHYMTVEQKKIYMFKSTEMEQCLTLEPQHVWIQQSNNTKTVTNQCLSVLAFRSLLRQLLPWQSSHWKQVTDWIN